MHHVKFLRNEDFDNLPVEVTKGSSIHDSLGFYNPDLKTAYIRDTGYAEVNKYLIDHEVSHMLEEHATDEDENGIRHKKKGGFARFFDTIFNPTTWFNPERQSEAASLVTGLPMLAGSFNQPKEDSQQQMSQSQFNPFQSQGLSMGGTQGQAAGYGTSDAGGQESSFSGLNESLNQQSQANPFASDQERFKYGAPAGRLSF